MDEPGKPCPNPRVVMPRRSYVPNVVDHPVTVDIRSFGVRCPPCTARASHLRHLGLFHVLPPRWPGCGDWWLRAGMAIRRSLTRRACNREGVGSFWPFATGRRVDQANILLDQIMETTETLFVLIPNQHIGCWQVGFAPQWIAREYLARRGARRSASRRS